MKNEIKKSKVLKIVKYARDRQYITVGTLEELIKGFGYTLKCGRSWESEKGNKKINVNPKSIKALITNLNNAVNNSASNGWAGVNFVNEVLTDEDFKKYLETKGE